MRTTAEPAWRFWIDRGGTFTDVVGCSPCGNLVVRKVLSEQPDCPGDPAVRAIAELLQVPHGAPLPPQAIGELRLGTTVATNALLEHRGSRVLLLINTGLADQLQLGDLHRPDLFALQIERPTLLQQRVIEVGGRLAANGDELEPLQLNDTLAQQLRQAVADGYRSVAIALLHSYRNPVHEQQLAAWLRSLELELEGVCLSHRLSPLPRLVPRGQTALVEAAVAPVLSRYLDQVEAALGGAVSLRVMRSSGALAPRDWLWAKDTILSGPAGGMVGAVAVAQQALQLADLPLQPVIGFDMGGTSTDVFHAALESGALVWKRSSETAIGGLQLQAPMLPIHTVAAGGGSVVRFADQRLQVGPDSAGADPGPAAYGRGGPLTITDANVLLGRLPLTALPAVFGPAGDAPLDPEPVRHGFAALAAAMQAQQPTITPEQSAAGALQVAIETMAAAIRRISIEQGHDPRQALLVSYGGAAAQHACRLAAELGMTRLLVHPLAGVLSAYGIGRAPQSLLLERSLRQPLDAVALQQIEQHVSDLIAEGRARLAQVIAGQSAALQVDLRLELRHHNQERGVLLPWTSKAGPDDLVEAFVASHRQLYGYACSTDGLVVERVLVELLSPPGQAPDGPSGLHPAAAAPALTTPVWLDAQLGWQPVPLWRREQLSCGTRLLGPALVVDTTTTLVLESGWQLQVLADGALLLELVALSTSAQATAPAVTCSEWVDPVRLELYHHRFAAIAVQMGVQLQQSARSLNIRERLDFSCALFDQYGELVANAPHIPVHLGSMGESVASLLAAIARGKRRPLAPGDVVVSNNPYNGGTHLPDITAITPVFVEGSGPEPLFFVASRGHHADVGGMTPGSMPANSHTIDDEGLLLDNVWLLDRGHLDGASWRARLAAMEHPVRDPELLLADLQAQVAANRSGMASLQALIERQGLAEVQAYMGHVQANAAAAVQRLIARVRPGSCSLRLDHGARICVRVAIVAPHGREHPMTQPRLCIDFTGTSPQHSGNRNAPLAVTRAVVLYVIRCLVGEAIPLNAGCFAPLELIVPSGCLLNPRPPAAVVAGNVEVSQATANALFLAFGVQAASQGTMNNLSFGDGQRQYYETIGGGCGAGDGYRGGSGFQSHMTNSRLTDPEVLEERLPVRVERMALRQGSGGAGLWPGGLGVVRQLRFLAPMQVSLISGCRTVPPPGLAGGSDGAVGRNLLLQVDGAQQELPGCCELLIAPGQALRIETPGGGGCGAPLNSEAPMER